MLRARLAAASLFVLTACGGPTKRPDGGEGLLSAEAQAPDFVAHDAQGKPVRLHESRGAASVVYFYPKDATPGCTREACAFRDAWQKFQGAHVMVFGVSQDSEESHRQFRASHQLPFPLAADVDGAIAKAYGVPSTLGMSARVSFLVGPDGRIAKVYRDVDPALHVDELLADVAHLPNP